MTPTRLRVFHEARPRVWGAALLALGFACAPPTATEPGRAASPLLATGVRWPADQLLPSFAAPAATQDLITLHGQPARWEAEGPAVRHKTGRLESDGWLCQVGVDPANDHMIYGPYDPSVPAGPNTAEFRLMTDDATADDAPVVTLEVYDSTAGQSLASQVVTRKQFPVAAQYTTFSLPFTLGADNHALELRVLWTGAAYTKVDWVGVTRGQAEDELVLFASLKGVVNATQPRIFSYEGDAFAEGPHAWLNSLGLGINEVADNWSLIAKYRSELAGLIVYDNAQPDTINLATTLAGAKKALVVAPSLVARLTQAPYDLPVLVDLRGRFTSKLAVYQTLHDTYWPTLPHRLAFGLNPLAVRAAVREYATAVGAAALWLDPESPTEAPLLDAFLSSMGAGATWMGWWPSEGPGVTEASKFGVATVASDYATNLTVHGGMSRTIHVKPMPPKPALADKIYVAFILSDGDNLQYVEHLLRKLWGNPDRGKVPMGWTMSPAMVDAMPGALDYFWTTSTTNDCLLSGPSGYGYTYPNGWTNAAQLDQFVETTEAYDERAGFRVVTVWNTITGGINANVGASYARNAPSLLGLTAQNTGGGLTIYGGKLPAMALACNYCTGEPAMKDFIAAGAKGWDGHEPRFLVIQAQPWQNVTPTSFLNVASSLGGDYVVVRPDHLFQLVREANGLPLDPVNHYVVTASAGAHGAIAPMGTVTRAQNENQTFSFTPDPGFVVDAVTIDGTTVETTPTYTFTNLTANHTIAISFSNGDAPDADARDGGADAPKSDARTGAAGANGDAAEAADGRSDSSGAGGLDAKPTAPGANAATGCACAVANGPPPSPLLLSLLGGALVLARRGRRRAVQSPVVQPPRG